MDKDTTNKILILLMGGMCLILAIDNALIPYKVCETNGGVLFDGYECVNLTQLPYCLDQNTGGLYLMNNGGLFNVTTHD